MTLTKEEIRVCTQCGLLAYANVFHHANKSWCRPCYKRKQREYQKAWRSRNPEKVKQYKRNWQRNSYERRREHLAKYWKKYRLENPDVPLRAGLKHRYGLSLEEFRTMEARQQGHCLCCGRKPKTGSPLVVDHCHATGVVRGLLCRNCNTLLGLAGDEPEVLRAAIEYLEGRPWERQ